MKLYIDHYAEIHKWSTMAFAVREWVLRNNHHLIIEDLKFLTRKWISVILYHNIARNLWNDRFLKENVESKIPLAQIERVPDDIDIYQCVLSVKNDVKKLIILERQFLVWEDWKKINAISTDKLTLEIEKEGLSRLWIWNINFRNSLLQICEAIEKWNIHRVHVLPWGKKNAIKHELFSLEWVWTLIWNDFWNPDIRHSLEWDENIIKWILESNKWNKYLKPRSKEYIEKNVTQFRIAYIDWIPVGCVEIIQEDENTIELWALAVVHSFLRLKIWMTLIEYVKQYAKSHWFGIISLTNNEKLQKIYYSIWFKNDENWKYNERANKSPWVKLLYIDYITLVNSILKDK
jgi:GNAT superfamily N-acetyltransferase